jgi:hypothetical protein
MFPDKIKATSGYGFGGPMWKSCLAIIAMAATLSGCAEYQARRDQERAQAIAANDDAKCRSYGVEPGSQAYFQCRMNLDNQRAAIAQAAVGGFFASGGFGGRR